ncbi:type I secretion system permease/ATPase [Planktomarina sp.]|nr:type I secretion system permease/ATPase [Planktomarina sp.]
MVGWVTVFSMFTNALMLTGPIYMLQIYDRVLSSQSVQTLIGLTLIIVFLYGCGGLLDFIRSRAMAQAGAILQTSLDKTVFITSMKSSNPKANSAVRDLESIQRFMTSPAYLALFDIVWTPLFLIGIMIFHPWLGYLAISGGAILIAVAILGQFITKRSVLSATSAALVSNQWSDHVRTDAIGLKSLGMTDAAYQKWQGLRQVALRLNISASNRSGVFTATTKTFRLLLQSLMLGLGAYLVLLNELTPGAMIAGSILLGRALAPVEMLVGQWSPFLQSRQAKHNLRSLLKSHPLEKEKMPLPTPKLNLEVEKMSFSVESKTEAILEDLTFGLKGGQALGVIGASGAGKTTLARLLTGAIEPTAGEIRLGGARLELYSDQMLGEYVGYVPQTVRMYPGTIGENIAKLDPNPNSENIVKASEAAAASQIILNLEKGYDTLIDTSSVVLSGGQVQRLGLARALYSEPLVLVLDEPNSNLDNEGTMALNFAIKQQKAANKIVVIMAHRPSAIQECDLLLVLDKGKMLGFGPKNDVLQKLVKNHEQIK